MKMKEFLTATFLLLTTIGAINCAQKPAADPGVVSHWNRDTLPPILSKACTPFECNTSGHKHNERHCASGGKHYDEYSCKCVKGGTLFHRTWTVVVEKCGAGMIFNGKTRLCAKDTPANRKPCNDFWKFYTIRKY